MKNKLGSYQEVQVKTSSQSKLIVLLYEKMIFHIEQAIDQIDHISGKPEIIEVVHNHISKAEDILHELVNSLDFQKGAQLAQDLFKLYLYCQQQLFEGNIEKSKTPLRNTLEVIKPLYESWEKISSKDTHERDIQHRIDFSS